LVSKHTIIIAKRESREIVFNTLNAVTVPDENGKFYKRLRERFLRVNKWSVERKLKRYSV